MTTFCKKSLLAACVIVASLGAGSFSSHASEELEAKWEENLKELGAKWEKNFTELGAKWEERLKELSEKK